jgi:uncharacterized protein
MSAQATLSVHLVARAKAIAERLKEQYGAQRVLLFGSVARGEAARHSDIDLLIVAPSDEPYHLRMLTVLRLVDDLSRDLALSPIVLTPDELRKRLAIGDPFIGEIVRSGRDL